MNITQNIHTEHWSYILKQLKELLPKKEIKQLFSIEPLTRKRGDHTLVISDQHFLVFNTFKGDVLYVGKDKEQALNTFLNKEKRVLQKA